MCADVDVVEEEYAIYNISEYSKLIIIFDFIFTWFALSLCLRHSCSFCANWRIQLDLREIYKKKI